MYFDSTSTIQELPQNLQKLLVDNGWGFTGRYRAYSSLGSDPYRKKFVDVRLFKSVGTDGQHRNIGFLHAYGVEEATLVGQEPLITQSSELGLLGVGNGTNKEFKFKVFPVFGHLSTVFIDGVEQPKAGYTINNEKGTVTFTTAPATGKEVRATYALTDNAPGMPARLFFFTYDDLRNELPIYQGGYVSPPESQLGTGTGSQTVFNFNVGTRTIKEGTAQIYVNGSPATNYTVDYVNKRVTFTTAPPAGASVTADFILEVTKDADGNFGDFLVDEFMLDNANQVVGAAYSVLNFILPSTPTAVSLTPDDEYSLGWFRDSAVYLWGNITKDRAMMFFKIDPAPDPTKSYFTPLYFGRLTTIGNAPKRNHIIASGCRTEDEVTGGTQKVLGRYSVNYGGNTGNGNSGVILQQSVGGAYNQKYYLSFITHDAMMEESFEARFNPSVYTGKYHISPIYIVHPNDGYVGRLDEVYAIHPKNISQMDELEVIEQAKDEEIGVGDGSRKVFHLYHTPVSGTFALKVACTPVTTGFTIDPENKTITFDTAPAAGAEILGNYDYRQVYKYTMPDAPISAFTLDAYSPYKPIGLGVLKENL